MKVSTAFFVTLMTSTSAFAAFDPIKADHTPMLAESLAKCSGQLQAGYDISGIDDVEAAATESRQALRYMVKALKLKEKDYLDLEDVHRRTFQNHLYTDLVYSRQRMKPLLSDCNAVLQEARSAYESEAARIKLAAEMKAEEARRAKVAFDTEQEAKRSQARVNEENAKQASLKAEIDKENAKQASYKAEADKEKSKQETARTLAESLVKVEQEKVATEEARNKAATPADPAKATNVAMSSEPAQSAPTTDGDFRPLIRGSKEKKEIDAKISDYVGCSEYFRAGLRLEFNNVRSPLETNNRATDFEALAYYTAKPHYAQADIWPIQDEAKRTWDLRNISNFWMMTREQDGFCTETHMNIDAKTMSAARANFDDMHKVVTLQ